MDTRINKTGKIIVTITGILFLLMIIIIGADLLAATASEYWNGYRNALSDCKDLINNDITKNDMLCKRIIEKDSKNIDEWKEKGIDCTLSCYWKDDGLCHK